MADPTAEIVRAVYLTRHARHHADCNCCLYRRTIDGVKADGYCTSRRMALEPSRITPPGFHHRTRRDWTRKAPHEGEHMIVLGIILLVLGYLLPIPILATIGWILLVVGAVLFVLGAVGRPVGGRQYWY
jgi:hypothetical protein